MKRMIAHFNIEIVKRSDQARASSRCPSAGSWTTNNVARLGFETETRSSGCFAG
jgi:hypothetical protein